MPHHHPAVQTKIRPALADVIDMFAEADINDGHHPHPVDDAQSHHEEVKRKGEPIVVHKYRNGLYRGNMKDGRKHGHGRLEYTDGDWYEGEFHEDEFHGHGTYRWASGARYTGKWVHGKRHGKGAHTSEEGDVYDGQWKNNQRHGLGTFTPASKAYVKESSWKRDECLSSAVIRFANGDVYDGELRNSQGVSQKHGFGKYTYADGRVYEGYWNKDRKEGVGIMTFPEGQRYEGQWKNEMRHGRGRWIYKSGNIYEGQFQNDMKHGLGKYIYVNEGQEEEYDFEYGHTIRGGKTVLDGM
eukprot:TRINITY_DN2014_c0_g2_i2.p1 TRINITY_DN2014_c0_g2~~TRINITY_DN2014_c0_g2_i2.p1  ORF type:complete len:298 (+),score=52.71 TRINITY_DN2014_c0_g2_i2:170-1063(+)